MIEYLVASSYQLITIHILSIPNYKHMIRENYKRKVVVIFHLIVKTQILWIFS